MRKLLTMIVTAFFGYSLFGALTDGLVAYYKFDGNANDSSGNGNNGVVYGATSTTDRLGKMNGAYSFDGDDWIQVANSDSLSLPTKAMSFCVWMRTEVEDGWVPFLSKGTYSRQYGFELACGSKTTLFINDYNGTGCGQDVFVVADSVSLNSGAWHFVALTYDGKEIRAYVNGNLIASRSVEDSFGVNSSDLYIGKDMSEVTEYFSGAMDDLRIYNCALSAEEVKALYEREDTPTTWYVNGTSGADGFSGKSSASAKKTIQAAIDVAMNGDTILVAAGTYAPIQTENKCVEIVGMFGASQTIIDAEGKSRCVTGGNLIPGHAGWDECQTNTHLVGFTLQNGDALVSDEQFGGGSFGCTLSRCIVRNCRASGGGGCCAAKLNDCLLVGNYAINGGASESSELYNCTLVENSVRDSGSAGWECVYFNCVVYGNEGNSTFFYWDEGDIARLHSISGSSCRFNLYTDNPHFVDAANGDYRLAADSPCINAGVNSYVTSETDFQWAAVCTAA